MVKLNIVIPIYNEQENLEELYRSIQQVCDNLSDVTWQVIYVNDGSLDDSMKIMLEQCKRDSRFSIVELSRNFGHQAAIAAGLNHASGDAVIVMDGDFQDPPELIPDLIAFWREGAEVVRAQRKSRKEHGIRRLGFEIFHRFFHWVSDFPVPTQTGVFGLLDKKAVEELNRLTEKNRFFPGLRSWVGFKQDVVYYDRQERAAGKPKQSIRRLIHYALNAVFSFSYKPLRIMTVFGVFISTFAFILACIFIIKRLAGIEIAQTGFTTLVTLILFMGGVQLVAIGLLGEYLARIYDEAKQRPLFIVKNRYGIFIQDS
ncbi:MAG: glycosyltransferase family 2 protein [Deltaproteobacteria bacterium]|nr:glycosyltransferase family 2 protein [Deltaproteobacteria bacterium]